MKSRDVALVVSLLTVAACTTKTDTVEVLPGGAVAAEDMPTYCAGQAASQFGAEAGDVAMSVIDHSGGIYTLHGRIPPEGTLLHTFQCQFDPQGVFISIVPVRFRS